MTQKDFRVKNGIEINGNAFIANSITSVDSIRFNTSVSPNNLVLGELAWSSDDNTVSIGLGVASLQLGQEEHIFIKNQSGETIGNGNVVMFAGTLGNSGRLLGRKAIADGTFPSKYIIGVATHDIADGSDGYVSTFGKIRSINTSMFSEGDILYADPLIPGGLSNTAPIAPNNKVVVAAVVNSDTNNGTLFVRPTFADKLADLQDVFIDNVTNNSTIAWNSANSRFETYTVVDTSNTINAVEDSSATPHYPVFVAAAGSNQLARVKTTATALSYVPSTGTLTTGALDVNGDVTVADKIIHSGDTDTSIRFPAVDTVTVETAGLERLRVDSAGNLGIGRTSGGNRLEVNGNVLIYRANAFNSFQIYSIGANASGSFVGTRARGTAEAITAVTNGDVLVELQGRGHDGTDAPFITNHISVRADENFTSTAKGTRIQFNTSTNGSTSGAERMRIDNAGNVGIGTSTPTSILHVNGDVTLTDKIIHSGDTDTSIRFPAADTIAFETAGTERLRINSQGNLGAGIATAVDSRIHAFGGNIRTTRETFAENRIESYANTGGVFFVGARARGTYAAPVAVQADDLLVSLYGTGHDGTSIPFITNHVAVRASETHTPSAKGTDISFSTSTNGSTSGTERARIINSGNFGIGTSAPASRLHVTHNVNGEGLIRINNSDSGNSALAGIRLNNDNGSASQGLVFLNGTGKTADGGANTMVVRNNIGNLLLQAAGQAGMTVLGTSGNVGIGTNTPNERLEVSGNIHVRGGDRTIYNRSNNYLALGTNNTERMRITNSGNVGIGNTNPTRTLVVNGLTQLAKDPASAEPQLRLTTATGSTEWAVGNIASSEDFGIRKFASSSWSTALRIGTDNRVSVNENPSLGTLYVRQIADTSDRGITVAAASGATLRMYVDGSNERHLAAAGTNILSFSESLIRLSTSGSEKLRVTTDGNVGIGTTTPTHKLEVNGSFAATTKSFLIDHPTKPGYKLRYGSLEGPENGVYVRGKLSGHNVIVLPDYWVGLVDEDSITVQLTAVGERQELFVSSISGNKVYIQGEIGKPINCFYLIQAERKDVEKLVVEYKEE